MRRQIMDVLSIITDEEQKYIDGELLETERYTTDKMVVDSKKLLLQGELIQIRPHTRFVSFPKHKHNYVEMTYCIQGSMTHKIDGKEIIMNEGDILLLNQNVYHEILVTTENDIAVNFIIMPEFFDKAFLMIEEQNFIWEFIISCARSNRYDTNYLYFKTSGIVPVENLMENLIWSILNKVSLSKDVTQTTLGLLLLNLSSDADIIEFGNSSLDNELRLAVYQFIDEQYKTAELSRLASNLGYEDYWLSKEIKKIFGKTFKDILMEKRLTQAAFLLRRTNLSVSEIIENVGYSNTSYFYRIFKEKFHVTPKEYRSSLKK